jgi:hypothetical protein
MSGIILLDVRDEIAEFLQVTDKPELPTMDLSSALDSIISSIQYPSNSAEDLKTLAMTAGYLAYGEGLYSGPRESVLMDMAVKASIYEAIMLLGAKLRQRLVHLHFHDQNQQQFTHRFREIERDRYLKLERVEFLGT